MDITKLNSVFQINKPLINNEFLKALFLFGIIIALESQLPLISFIENINIQFNKSSLKIFNMKR